MDSRDSIMDEYFFYRDKQLFCENIPVCKIAGETGTPVFIYSKAVLKNKYRALASAFSEINTSICFSVKSCSNLSILKVLAEEGSGFDIVSGGELFRVKKACGDTSKALFSGVGKTDYDIRYALDNDIMLFNVESREELQNINNIAGELLKSAPVSLRINPDVDPNTHYKTTTGKKENKFGIDIPIAREIINNTADYPSCTFKGISMHIGSPIYEVKPYSEALEKVLDFIDSCPDFKNQIEYINCGGGFGLLYNSETVPSFDEYASSIIPYIRKTGCKLLLEPGRSISGNAGILVGEVQYRKLTGEKIFVILDAGMHNLVRTAMYDAYHGIWHVNGPHALLPGGVAIDDTPLFPTDVVGPVCETSDTFCIERPLPFLERGALVAIFSTGAYGYSMSSNYNSHPLAVEVMVDKDEWRVIHKRQTMDNMIMDEIL